MAKDTDIGRTIRTLREAKKLSRDYFAEMIGISVSHLEKIETGGRRPGIGTFFKILDVLDADIVMYDEHDTIGQCASKMREIVLQSTEEQAVFMLRMTESIAENMHILMESKE